MRYRDQGHELNVELPAATHRRRRSHAAGLFDRQYRRAYSRTIPNLGMEALTWMLVLVGKRRTGDQSSARSVRSHIERTKPVLAAEILDRGIAATDDDLRVRPRHAR